MSRRLEAFKYLLKRLHFFKSIQRFYWNVYGRIEFWYDYHKERIRNRRGR